jgi:hypothetical protein
VSTTSIPPDFAFAIKDGHICKFDFPLIFAEEEEDKEIPPNFIGSFIRFRMFGVE